MRFWILLLAAETVVLTGFLFAAVRSDYFTRMPDSVRQGESVSSLVLQRVFWLALVLGVFNASVLCWMRGVELSRANEREAAALSKGAGAALFLAACLALVALAVFGFGQY